MDTKKYKAFHEAAVSNNSGTTPEHTLLCIFVAAMSSSMVVIGRRNRARRFQLLVEYFGLILPMVLGYNLLSTHMIEISKVIIGIIYIQCTIHLNRVSAFRAFKKPNVFNHQRMECITNIRGVTYIITFYCILAVDFASFPRILAKTERYGYSLMDTGVGLFTIGSGLVHRRYTNPRIGSVMKDNLNLLVVLAIGLMRTFLVKSLDYHEHVTEYGVHWNYFYTLSVVKLTSTFLLHFTPKMCELLLCAVVLVTHHVFLHVGVEKWVFSDVPRDSFLNANREGIASCLGYVFLYLFGAYIRGVLTDRTVTRRIVLSKLSIVWVLSFVLIFHTSYLLPVSRTLGNPGYCIYIIALFMVVIILMYMMEVIMNEYQVSSVPIMVEAVNENGLFLFILGNIVTGMVNMIFQTLLLDAWIATFILSTYMKLLMTTAVYLHTIDMKIL